MLIYLIFTTYCKDIECVLFIFLVSLLSTEHCRPSLGMLIEWAYSESRMHERHKHLSQSIWVKENSKRDCMWIKISQTIKTVLSLWKVTRWERNLCNGNMEITYDLNIMTTWQANFLYDNSIWYLWGMAEHKIAARLWWVTWAKLRYLTLYCMTGFSKLPSRTRLWIC